MLSTAGADRYETCLWRLRHVFRLYYTSNMRSSVSIRMEFIAFCIYFITHTYESQGKIAQSVWRRATSWTEIFLYSTVSRTSHPASYPMGTRASFHGVKWPGREADHSVHLVPRSRMMQQYLHSPIQLYVMVII
jgi:hypothetical protein